jgi:hypothetical protein
MSRWPAPMTLAALLRATVLDTSGAKLGHVDEVIAVRSDAGGELTHRVEGVVVGGRGLALRLGLGHKRPAKNRRNSTVISVADVVSFENETLVVHRR